MRILFAFLFFMSFAQVSSQAQAPSVASLVPKLESLIRTTMQQKKIPGMAVAVVSRGKIIYIKGFGVRTLGQKNPVDVNTLFQIGSVSKAITSTLVAILNRENALSLDQPVNFIPGATLRHVLGHTTGLPSAGFNALIENGISAKDMQKKLQEAPIIKKPGEKFAYHNAAYNLIVEAIERQVGGPFEKILQMKLLHPLGMTRTSSTWNGFISQENRASAHVFKTMKGKKGKGLKKSTHQAPYRQDYTNFPAAGGFSSSIHDMALFLTAAMGGQPDVVSTQDMSDFMLPLIHTPDQWWRTQKHRDRITQTTYGLGWRHMIFGGHPVVFHGGGLRGSTSMLAFLPEEQVGIVILHNAGSFAPFQITMQFLDWALNLPSKQWVID